MGNLCGGAEVERPEEPARLGVRFSESQKIYDDAPDRHDHARVVVSLAAVFAAEVAFQQTDEGIGIRLLGDLAIAAAGPQKPRSAIAGLSNIPLAADMPRQEEYIPAGYHSDEDSDFFSNEREGYPQEGSSEESDEESESDSTDGSEF